MTDICRGHAIKSGDGRSCQSTAQTGFTLLNNTETNTIWSIVVSGPGISVAWHATDLPLLRENAASSTSEVSSASRTVSSFTEAITYPSSPPLGTSLTSTSELSTGARAGIGVGAAAAGLIIVLALFIAVKRCRHPERSSLRKDTDIFTKPELPGESKTAHAEIFSGDVHEVDGQNKLVEAENSNVRAELESDWAGWEAPTAIETEPSAGVNIHTTDTQAEEQHRPRDTI